MLREFSHVDFVDVGAEALGVALAFPANVPEDVEHGDCADGPVTCWLLVCGSTGMWEEGHAYPTCSGT